MVLGQVSLEVASAAASVFSVIQGYLGDRAATIILLTLGIALYTALVGTAYNFISKRELYTLSSSNRQGLFGTVARLGSAVVFIIQYTVLFPIISFAWFFVLSTALFLLSRTATLETVFMLTLSVLAAVRLLAYYREGISADLAKMLPLALLGVAIVEPTLFNTELVRTRVEAIIAGLPSAAAFLAAIIVMEWVLRIIYAIAKALGRVVSPAPSGKPPKEA